MNRICACGALCSLAALLACDHDEASPYVVYEDEGELCMFADEAVHGSVPAFLGTQEVTFEAGDRLHVTVSAPDCLSSSCDIAHEASCGITREGNTLEVESRLVFEPTNEAMCTMDCARLVARCQSEPLEAGQYTVVLGEHARSLSVPSTLAGACR